MDPPRATQFARFSVKKSITRQGQIGIGFLRREGSSVPRREEIGVAFSMDLMRKQRFDFMKSLYDMTYGRETGLLYIAEIAQTLSISEIDTEFIARFLADEGLIKIRLNRIISLTHIGIDEVETAMQRPNRPTKHFPALHSVVQKPAFTSDPGNDVGIWKESDVKQDVKPEDVKPDKDAPSFPGKNAPSLRDRDIPSFPVSSDRELNASDDESAALELKLICEAIGLNPEELQAEHPNAHAAALDEHHMRSLLDSLNQSAGVNAEASAFKAAELAENLALLKERLPELQLSPDDMAEAQSEIDTAQAQLSSPRPKRKIISASLETLLSILENAGSAALTSEVASSLLTLRACLQRLRA